MHHQRIQCCRHQLWSKCRLAPSSADHDLSACVVVLVGAELTVHSRGSKGSRWVREVLVAERKRIRPKGSYTLFGTFLDVFLAVDAVAFIGAAVDELLRAVA
jgi:hypothetical protein